MATTFWFNGSEITIPGVYARIVSGIKNPIRDLDYGTLLLIDTGFWNDPAQATGKVAGMDTGWGSGPGMQTGGTSNSKKAIQLFDNVLDFQEVMMGGPFWKAAEFLFQPNGFTIPGISQLYYISLRNTTPAQITFAPTGGGSAGGSLVIKAKNEGVVGNGVLGSVLTTNLEKGFSYRMRDGKNTGKWVLDFYRGNWVGRDTDGIEWNGRVAEKSLESKVVSTPEFSNVEELNTWMTTNVDFKKWFELSSYTKTGTGDVTAADQTTYAAHQLFAGGAETYLDLTNATIAKEFYGIIKELDYVYVLSDIFGEDAKADSSIASIISHFTTDAKYDKYIAIGGGRSANEWSSADGTIAIAEDLDTSRAVVAHGDFYKSLRITGSTESSVVLKQYSSFMKAAAVMGRILGKEPQVPGTFKEIDIDGEVHQLSDDQIKDGLNAGVLMTKWDNEVNDYIIIQSVNTLQDNNFLVNDDAQSHTIEIERIKAQLNKEIVVNARRELLGQENGVNRNTLSAQDLKSWIEGYLKRKTATVTDDNLILSYQKVTVETKQDAHICSYEFVPNYPVNKLIITGVIIDI